MKKILIPGLVLFYLLSTVPNCTTKKDDTVDKLALLLILGSVINSACKNPSPIPGGTDPLFSSQWHLSQPGGEDAGVTGPWSAGKFGKGVVVAVVDDGLETTHEDLCGNLSTVASYNYFRKSTDPNHYYTDTGHGTNVAGVIAAQYDNNVGLRGAAPGAKLTARNLLELSSLGSSDISASMTLGISSIHVSNNSWGAPDGYGYYEDGFASSLWKTSIESGYTNGRGGKGTLYTWAGGNGAYRSSSGSKPVDNSNMDGQANFHGVLAICGVGKDGKKAWYSEDGANLWVCAHTLGNDRVGISTTDRLGDKGENSNGKSGNFTDFSYTNTFSGTSSAAPLAAGVIAILLGEYPDLSWRDVREILAKSARMVDPTDSDWLPNGAGFNTNHKYGFGAIHAERALQTASTWTRITSPYINWETNTVNASSNTITFSNLNTGITKIEYVEISFTTDHPNIGELSVNLQRGSGTVSKLIVPHDCYTSNQVKTTCEDFSSLSSTIRLGSARHLGESASGNWTIAITESPTRNKSYSAKLKFYGRAN